MTPAHDAALQLLRDGLRDDGDRNVARLIRMLSGDPNVGHRALPADPTWAAAIDALARLGMVEQSMWGDVWPKKWLHHFPPTDLVGHDRSSIWTITDLPPQHPPERNSHPPIFPYRDEADTLIKAISRSNVIAALHATGRTQLRVLDMCTGSGAIALWVAKAFPNVQVVAVDTDGDAISQARENQALNQVRNVTFQKGELFEGLTPGSFDLIIADPPVRPALPGSEVDSTSAGLEGDSITNAILNTAFEYLRQEAESRLLILGYSIGEETALSTHFTKERPDAHRLGRFMLGVAKRFASHSRALGIQGGFQHAGPFALRFMHCKALPNPCPLLATILRLADKTRTEYISDKPAQSVRAEISNYIGAILGLMDREKATHLHYVLGEFRLTESRPGTPRSVARRAGGTRSSNKGKKPVERIKTSKKQPLDHSKELIPRKTKTKRSQSSLRRVRRSEPNSD